MSEPKNLKKRISVDADLSGYRDTDIKTMGIK